MSVGAAIESALARAATREKVCPRQLRIRLTPYAGEGPLPGLLVRGTIAARDPSEMDRNRATRLMLWSELDTEAAELPRLVDEVADELEYRFGIDGAAA